jgi:hypothetical protein
MLTSVLAYLPNSRRPETTIDYSIALAKRTAARVRGLAIVDTRAAEAACQCESAVYADLVCRQLGESARGGDRACRSLTQACLEAELDFDVRRVQGDPRRLLPREAQFHDLVVACLDDGRGDDEGPPTTFNDLAQFAQLSGQPALIVRPGQQPAQRVLLLYDGSASSGRAIRSFLDLGILPEADCRLQVVGPSESVARDSYRDMADYCAARRPGLELGWTVGPVHRVAPRFAERWQADLAVLGLMRGPRYLRRFWGAPEALLRANSKCALYSKV